MRDYVIGIDVGGTNIRVGLFDREYKALKILKTLTDNELEPERMIAKLKEQVNAVLIDARIDRDRVAGVGAAFPSYIDYENGVIVETSNISALNDMHVRSQLAEALQLPVFVDNDANAAALAEHRFGAGKGYSDLIYCTVSTGIGGALIINDRLYRGMHGMAGEIGHMFISDSTGYPCSCGVTGCVQSIASGVHMARYAIDSIKEGMDSSILDHAGTLSRVDMVAVSRALANKDPLAIELVERGAEYLGRMFHSLNQIFDINVFVYDGGVMKLGKPFVDRIIAAYRRYTLMDKRYPATFLPAQLGGYAGITGAALLVPMEEK